MTLFDQLVAELTKVFAGREQQIRQVKESIRGTSRGVLWISGKPGVGKSALMVKLVRDYQGQPHYFVIPYFFRFGQVGCPLGEFLNTSLKQIQAWLGRKIEQNLTERERKFVEAVRELTGKAGDKGRRKVLFLIDGLDEIYRKERDFLNLPFMAQEENVIWVCAGRSEPELEDEFEENGEQIGSLKKDCLL